MSCKILILAIGLICAQGYAAPACNTRSGQVAAPPAQPHEVDEGLELVQDMAASDSYDAQTLKLDLGKDIEALPGLRGKYTRGIPVIGVRLENLPDFDGSKHCNRITIQVYKPKLERFEGGRVRASVDGGRFAIQFSTREPLPPWRMDEDGSKRFVWIFPGRFGKLGNRPWKLTENYDAAFQKATHKDHKRWIAEAWINLSLRTYRNEHMVAEFPADPRPSRQHLREVFKERLGVSCHLAPQDLRCLAAELVELNEAAPPGDYLSKDAFRTGDALLANSGVSTGLRQLDFSTRNEQANQLVSLLLPNTLGKQKLHTGYRQPIRMWHVEQLNTWYEVDGKEANRELSRPDAKQHLLASHVEFVGKSVGAWQKRIDNAYKEWPASHRAALSAIAIDLENVSGMALHLPAGAQTLCDVLTNSKVLDGNGRSNHSVARTQAKRVRNAATLFKARLPEAAPFWPCK